MNFVWQQVRAYDEGIPVRSTEVSVDVSVERNEFAPEFNSSHYEVTVSENQANNSAVFTMRATDRDLRGQMTYEVVGLAPAPRFFGVAPSSGVVTVVGELRGDRGLTYVLLVEAYDSGNPAQRAAAQLTITVSRNEHAPRFRQPAYALTLLDSAELGALVTTLQADDSDVTDRLEYSLLSDALCIEYLYVNARTGGVYLKQLLTSDASLTELECRVEVTDNGYPRAQRAEVALTLEVERNSELPRFTRDSYELLLREAAAVNVTLLTLQAQLSVVSGQLVYQLVGDYPAPHFFRVLPSSGEIQVSSHCSRNIVVVSYAHTQR